MCKKIWDISKKIKLSDKGDRLFCNCFRREEVKDMQLEIVDLTDDVIDQQINTSDTLFPSNMLTFMERKNNLLEPYG